MKRYIVFFAVIALLLTGCENTTNGTGTDIDTGGEMCGGIAGIGCSPGFVCVIKESYPDASGTCVPEEKEKPVPVKDPSAGVLPETDYSCSEDLDCTIKNVGNCCGYYPQCVNANAFVDPEAVARECAEKGLASVCGFPEIKGCKCIEGRCSPI